MQLDAKKLRYASIGGACMTDGNGERRAGRHTPAFDLTVLPEPAFAGAAKIFLDDPLRHEIMPHVGDREA